MAFAPRLVVLVQVSRDIDDASFRRDCERVLLQVPLCAKRSGGRQSLGVGKIRAVGDREELGARSQGAADRLGRDDLERETGERARAIAVRSGDLTWSYFLL